MDDTVRVVISRPFAELVADSLDHNYDAFVNAGATPKEITELQMQLRRQ